MKVKMKFDLATIKNFAVEHGEKLAFGLVAIVFLYFVYSAVKRETLDASKQPDRLREKANQVQTRIEQSTFDPKPQGLAVVDYTDRAKLPRVDAKAYVTNVVLDKPIIDQKIKRDEPMILSVEELKADSGYGVFALEGGNGGEAQPKPAGRGDESRKRIVPPGSSEGYKPKPTADLKPQPWAVVTGLVPVQKQAQEYSRVFDNADGFDKERDVPRYAGARVERAEINPAQPDKLEWKPLDPKLLKKFESRWEAAMNDVVRDVYLDAELTRRLGPLVRGTWGESAAHPKIPLAATRDQSRGAAAPTQPEPTPVQPAAAGPDEDSDSPYSNRPKNPSAATNTAPARNAQTTPASGVDVIEYRLFRFFDYTVEAKKKYRYRVKLGLDNPNFGVAVKFLSKPNANAPTHLESEWSEQSELVAIPDRYGVLSGGLAGGSSKDEPSAKLMVTAIDPSEGLEVSTELDLRRAGVANTVVEKVDAIDPRNDSFEERANVAFETGIVVLDVRGGRPLAKKSTTTLIGPVEVLVLDPQGNLRVRRELDDHALVVARKPPEEEDKDKKGTDPIPPDSSTKKAAGSRAPAVPKAPPGTKAAPKSKATPRPGSAASR